MTTDLTDRVKRRRWPLIAAMLLLLAAAAAWLIFFRRLTVTEGKFPEELVYVRTNDDIVEAGVMFDPPKAATKPVALIWIHGWGANFYSPTYVNIGRALAARGYRTIAGNTRMHDIGNVLGERHGKRLRGGGYWGVASEEVRDVAAWVDFAEGQGIRRIVLVGHSAGWAAVRAYQAQTQDPRVVGVVLASGEVRADMGKPDPQQLADATRMMAAGRPDDLVRIPNRPFPSFISAATFLDIASTPPEYLDFFGVQTPNAGVTRVRCPLLAFFGTRESYIGSEADLKLLASSVKRQSSGPARVTTVMIRSGDHMYTGEEAQVAETIAAWADSLPPLRR